MSVKIPPISAPTSYFIHIPRTEHDLSVVTEILSGHCDCDMYCVTVIQVKVLKKSQSFLVELEKKKEMSHISTNITFHFQLTSLHE